MYTKQIEELQKDIYTTISSLANEFRRLIENASVNKDDTLRSSEQKLELDVHTMTLDQKSRHLLEIIRRLKELKIVTAPRHEERAQFEGECIAAAGAISECLAESAAQLSALSGECAAVLQDAYKLLN